MNNTEEILGKLQEIVRFELDNDNIVLQENSLASDIEDWDSIANIQIIGAIEEYYSINFNALDIQNWKNIGELCQSIQTLLNKN